MLPSLLAVSRNRAQQIRCQQPLLSVWMVADAVLPAPVGQKRIDNNRYPGPPEHRRQPVSRMYQKSEEDDNILHPDVHRRSFPLVCLFRIERFLGADET